MLKILFKPYVILPLAVILAAAAGLFYFRSAEIGNDIGTGAGKAAGLAVGSYKGITEGYASGMAEGKDMGLSAEDTMMEVMQTIRETGNLEVLAANVEIPD